jgi:hypothetical protein
MCAIFMTAGRAGPSREPRRFRKALIFPCSRSGFKRSFGDPRPPEGRRRTRCAHPQRFATAFLPAPPGKRVAPLRRRSLRGEGGNK